MKNRVREMRAAKEMSQAELGATLGVSRQTIIAIERGRYLPSLPLAISMARFFSMSVEELFIMDGGGRRR